VVIVAYNYGAGERERVRKAYRVSLALGWSFMLLSYIVFLLFTPFLVSIFTTEEETVKLAIPAFRSLSCCFLLTAPNIITTGLLQGLGKGAKSMAITYIRFFILLVPIAYLLSYLGGFSLFCYSFFFADIPTLLVIYLLVRSERKNLY